MRNLKKKVKKIIRRIKNFSKVTILFICVSILLFCTLGITYGRYVYKEIRNYYFSTQNFYFNSDKLKENLAHYQIDNWSGVDNFNITINMNSLKNNKVGATVDIDYTIDFRCSTNITCTSTKNNGTIYTSTHSDYFTITLTPNTTLNEGDSVWLNVSAMSSDPYEKEISGRFVINIGIPGLSYEIVDSVNSPYLELNITNTLDYYKVISAFGGYVVGDKLDIGTYLSLSTTDKENCASAIINVSFDPNVILLDMTNSAYLRAINESNVLIGSYNYINGISFKIDALSSEVVKFYKKDTSYNYTYPFVNPVSVVQVSYTI